MVTPAGIVFGVGVGGCVVVGGAVVVGGGGAVVVPTFAIAGELVTSSADSSPAAAQATRTRSAKPLRFTAAV